MYEHLLIADRVIDLATELEPRRHFVTPFLVVEFSSELEEPFVFATMEVAAE